MVQNRSCRYFKPELLFSCGLYSEHCELDSFSSLLFHSHNEDNILRSVDWISFNQEKLRTLSQESCDRVLKTQIQIQEKQDYLTQLQREDKEYYDQQIKLQRLLYERRRHFEERQRVSVECDRLSAYFERQINECQPRIDKLKLELKNFRPQVSKLQRQYDENRRKIDQRQRRIDRRQRQIVMREHRIDKNQELLGERNLLFRDDKIQVDELFCQYEARQCQSQLEKRIDEGNKRENDLWDRRYEEVMRQIDLIRRQTFECERLSKKGDRQYDENMRQSNERYDENMRQSNERQRQIDY